ncbi:efflux transporter outer membrane subunit [Methylocapsa acidiphila]|uniref:efflux transporter outer membrane subunit n=1 Tax=Methylocapsa acidiphila TaxID=133552 RepID=UPI00040057C8|nr:efflux transporter outer membrane subunit [Methylocapsa acidiphila]
MNARQAAPLRRVTILALVSTLASIPAGCTVGPDYERPPAPEPAKYKELKGWKLAAPGDGIDRGAWWAVFKDPLLDSLERQVEISNQTVLASEATYRQARAVIKEAQAGLFPTITANYSATDTHLGRALSGTGRPSTSVTSDLTSNASWDLDVWGKIRRTVESDVAGAQASAADLADATLSEQALLATAYFNLRAADSLETLLTTTVKAYRKTLEITQHQYDAGTVSKADVATALAQVLNTEASAINVGVSRAQFEHSIAVLIGRPPAELSIPKGALANNLPTIPVSLPSTLLERRPDIAAAERTMQQQNALIGAAIALYYPDISLSASYGFSGPHALALSLAHETWTAGVAASQTIFDGGLKGSQVEAARASFDQSVATYRNTVLTAFQQVEDNLAALRIYARQATVEGQAVKAAQEELDILLNQYRAGTVAFTAVVVAQATLLSDQESDLTIRQNRYLSSVSLIEALGGGWDAGLLPTSHALEAQNPMPHL